MTILIRNIARKNIAIKNNVKERIICSFVGVNGTGTL